DIRACFDEIPHDRLLERLQRLVADPRVLALIRRWLRAYGTRGIPQGSPLSPLLANLYLDELDRGLRRRGYAVTRYADDFVILCRNRAEAEAARVVAEAILRGLGLRLNPDKTAITSFRMGFEFLGHRLAGNRIAPLKPGWTRPSVTTP